MKNKVIKNPKLKVLFRSATIYLVAGLFIFAAIFSVDIYSSSAANLTDLYKQQTQASDAIRQNTAAAQAKQAEATQLASDVRKIDSDIAAIQAKINETQSQINETEKSITETENEIKQKEEDLKTQIGNRNEAIKVIYENSRTNTFEVILGSDNLSEVVNHNEYVDALEQKIETTIDEINKLKDELERKKSGLEEKKQDLDNLHVQQQAYKDGLSVQQSQKNSLLKTTKSQQSENEKQAAEAEKLYSQLSGTIKDMELKARRGSNWPRSDTSAQGFSYPTASPTISYVFGYSQAYFGGTVYHSGVDFSDVYAGDSVFSSKDGIIVDVATGCGNTYPGGPVIYGNYVKIQHEGGAYTLYAHLSYLAPGIFAGTQVSKGQTIGYVGSTGYSSGPHLHFEIRAPGDIPVDPAPLLP